MQSDHPVSSERCSSWALNDQSDLGWSPRNSLTAPFPRGEAGPGKHTARFAPANPCSRLHTSCPCTWPRWVLFIHFYVLPGISSQRTHLGLTANEALHHEDSGWMKPRTCFGLEREKVCFFIAIYFYPIDFYTHAWYPISPIKLQHLQWLQHDNAALRNWQFSLYNSALCYQMNGAPAFSNYHLQFSFE